MLSKCVLTGGAFQDSEGNVLANGYLQFELSQDSSVTGVGNVASGITITINLDANGNVSSSPAQSVWGNDVLLPVNSFYKVTGYTSAGQPAWGPNNQQVTGTALNLGTWVPNQVVSWSPSVQSVILQTDGTNNTSQLKLNLNAGAGMAITDAGNGTINFVSSGSGVTFKTNGSNNGSQAILNLINGNGMTITDGGSGNVTVAGVTLKTNGTSNGSQKILNLKNGTSISISDDGVGGITISSSSGVPTGSNVIPLPSVGVTFPGTTQSTINTSGSTNSLVQFIPGTDLRCQPMQWTVSLRTVSSSTIIQAVIAKCAIGSLTVLSTTPITFSSSATPTLAPAGTYTSDVIAMALDTAHDYYIILNTSTGLMGLQENGTGQSGSAGGVYVQASNFLSVSPLSFTGGTNEPGKALTVQFLSA